MEVMPLDYIKSRVLTPYFLLNFAGADGVGGALTLGEHQEIRRGRRIHVFHHPSGAADVVGARGDFLGAFGVGHDLQAGKLRERLSGLL